MKNLGFLMLAAMTFTFVACGNKDNNSGGNNDPWRNASANAYGTGQIATANGLINTQTPIFEVDGSVYTISQQSYQIMNNAVQIANQQGIQPILSNGLYKYKVRVTGSVSYGGSYQTMQYPTTMQYPNTSYGGATLIVTSAVIYR